jgi:outer membrane protein OmpA-like peptidoglycan-associated protein
MARPGSASAPDATPARRRAPARVALAVGLLVLGFGSLAVINFWLVPLRAAELSPRLPALAHLAMPASAQAAPAPATAPPAPVLAAAVPVYDAQVFDTRAPDTGPTVPVADAPPAPLASAPGVPPEEFPDLLFALSTTWLSRPSRETLDRLAEALALNPERRVVLSGHTDGAGDPVFNRALSRERAERAASYLRARGLEPSRIEVRAFGAKQPAEGSTRDSLARNRRVEITVE